MAGVEALCPACRHHHGMSGMAQASRTAVTSRSVTRARRAGAGHQPGARHASIPGQPRHLRAVQDQPGGGFRVIRRPASGRRGSAPLLTTPPRAWPRLVAMTGRSPGRTSVPGAMVRWLVHLGLAGTTIVSLVLEPLILTIHIVLGLAFAALAVAHLVQRRRVSARLLARLSRPGRSLAGPAGRLALADALLA